MRNKKKRPSSGTQCTETQATADRERPMSWEGELSDSEMVIDTSANNGQYFITFFILIKPGLNYANAVFPKIFSRLSIIISCIRQISKTCVVGHSKN